MVVAGSAGLAGGATALKSTVYPSLSERP